MDPHQFANLDFSSLSSSVQQILFSNLRKEMTALRQSKYNADEHCPDIDIKLYQTPPFLPCPSNLNRSVVALPKRAAVQRLWSYARQEREEENPNYISCGSYDLTADNPESELRLRGEHEARTETKETTLLASRISSQLLLYRLICILQMPLCHSTEEGDEGTVV